MITEGYLVPSWTTSVRERFAFMRELDDFEERIARCNRGDEWEVRQAIAGFSDDVRTDAE